MSPPLSVLLPALLALAVSLTHSLPNGAPTSVCDTMLPAHSGIPARTTASPFAVRTAAAAVNQGDQLTVEIVASPPELMFGGFMLHAVNPDATDEQPSVVGQFVAIDANQVKGIACGSENSTVTHTSTQPKGSGLAFAWRAPEDFVGEVVFVATVAQKYDVFWVGLQSEPVLVVAAGQPLPEGGAGGATAGRPTVSPTSPPFVRPDQEEVSVGVFCD